MDHRVALHAFYRPPPSLLDEDAPERWIFLEFDDDGRVLVLTPQHYESTYRPAPEDQG